MPYQISQMQMRAWRRMESEHSESPRVQERIVRQHVNEYGLGYYPALKKMESHLKKR